MLAEPVPEMESAGWNGGIHSWQFVGEHQRYGDMRTPEQTRLFAVDCRRRFRISALVKERGLPPEVEELADLLCPYGSVVHRWGWPAEVAIREGKTTEAAIEERARAWLARFLAA